LINWTSDKTTGHPAWERVLGLNLVVQMHSQRQHLEPLELSFGTQLRHVGAYVIRGYQAEAKLASLKWHPHMGNMRLKTLLGF